MSPITGAQMVEQNLLKMKWEADQARQQEAQDKLDLYMDDFEQIIKIKMAELFHPETYDRLKWHVNQSQNIIKRVINEISTIYRGEPTRVTDPESSRYNDLIAATGLNVTMKKINRYTNLLNETLLKIGFRDNQIVYDIITPNICTVVQNRKDPTQPDAIVYEVTRSQTVGDPKIYYHYWSLDGDYIIYNQDYKEEEIIYDHLDPALPPYPYIDPETKRPILPFVIFHKQEPDYTFWDEDTGRDLYNATVATAIKMSLLDYYFKTGSFKQIYMIGDKTDVPAKQTLDPLTILIGSGENASIGVLDREVDLEQLKDSIIFQINTIINNYGISADQYSLSVAEMSGRALKIRNRGLFEIRNEQLPIYRREEEDLFKITRIVNNAHFTGKMAIPEKTKFSIDFAELEIAEDPGEELELLTKKLRSGIISLAQFYQHFNPDVKDEKAAEKSITDNLKALEDVRAKYPNLDEALNFILGEKKEERPAGEEEE